MKLFLSHSSKDIHIVKSFVNFMLKIGLKDNDMFCSSVAGLGIPVQENIFDYLRNLLNQEIFVIYFLSDNYYNSPICLNEMGASWIKQTNSLAILLPGFSYKNIKGVVDKNKIHISLNELDHMTKSHFNNFKEILSEIFSINISEITWEKARDEFFNDCVAVQDVDMQNSESFCIGDQSNDGCKIIKHKSNNDNILAEIDFSKTSSDLSSIVFFINNKNWMQNFSNNKHICFSIYAEGNITCAEIEIHFEYQNKKYPILVSNDTIEYKIPLSQFTNNPQLWSFVKEIDFLFIRKNTHSPSIIHISNLKIT